VQRGLVRPGGIRDPDNAESGLIPVVDVAQLFSGDPAGSAPTDRAILSAAREIGFLCIRGLPHDVPMGAAARARLLAIFSLNDAARRRLHRRKFAPENPNIYRGWFPLQPGNLTAKEGIDIGADVAYGAGVTRRGDPLRECTPLPAEEDLPGWRQQAALYYRSMERVAQALMHSLARSLGLQQEHFDAAFHQGLSTLRLIRYPPRQAAELATVADPRVWVEWQGTRRHLAGAPHTDSGFVTLLAQDGIPGLQVRSPHGEWLDVPPLEGTLVVNFGQVLEQWTARRIRATEHRVLGVEVARCSMPFFYEARAEAVIAPLPIDAPDQFAPFVYGDFLWKRVTTFVEFRGMESERAGTGSR
jgi:isopenicillin N synthase-like dioxygenase